MLASSVAARRADIDRVGLQLFGVCVLADGVRRVRLHLREPLLSGQFRGLHDFLAVVGRAALPGDGTDHHPGRRAAPDALRLAVLRQHVHGELQQRAGRRVCRMHPVHEAAEEVLRPLVPLVS